MDSHLERALIEVFFAIAEFEQAKDAGERGTCGETGYHVEKGLRTIRFNLESILHMRQASEADGTMHACA